MGREEEFQQQFLGELAERLDKLLVEMLQRAASEGNLFESAIPNAILGILGFAAKVATDIGLDEKHFINGATAAHRRAVAYKAGEYRRKT